MNPIPVTLNHIALDVRDSDRSIRFYQQLLGAEIVGSDDEFRITFLRLPGSPNFSDIALHEHDDIAGAYPPEQMRMAHTGWEIHDEHLLVAAFDFFTEETRVVMAADFGHARSVMGADPDGHVIEFQLFRHDLFHTPPVFTPLDIDGLRDAVAAS